MDFVEKFYAIITFSLCAPGSSIWWSCVRQSMVQMVVSLVFLLFEALWHFIFTVITGCMVIIICSTIIYMYRKIKILNDRLMNHQTQSQSTHVTVQGVDKPKVTFNHNQMASVDTDPQGITVNSKQSHISNKVPRPKNIVEREELTYRQDVRG